MEIAKDMNRPLYIMFVREQAILTLEDRNRTWKNDREAGALFTYVKKKADGQPVLPCYAVSDVPAHTVVDLAVKIGATLLILGAPRRYMLVKLIRGNMVRRVSRFLPEEIHPLGLCLTSRAEVWNLALVDGKVGEKFLIRARNQNLQIMGVTLVVSSRAAMTAIPLPSRRGGTHTRAGAEAQ